MSLGWLKPNETFVWLWTHQSELVASFYLILTLYVFISEVMLSSSMFALATSLSSALSVGPSLALFTRAFVICSLSDTDFPSSSRTLFISSFATSNVCTSWCWWVPSIKHSEQRNRRSCAHRYSVTFKCTGHLFPSRSAGSSTKTCIERCRSSCFFRCPGHSDISQRVQNFTAATGSSRHWSHGTTGPPLSPPPVVATRNPSTILLSLKFLGSVSRLPYSSLHSGHRFGDLGSSALAAFCIQPKQ